MISVDLYLLQYHKPSGQAEKFTEFYLDNAAGIKVNITHIETAAHMKWFTQSKKVRNLPAMDVPGKRTLGRSTREMIVGVDAIEKWCKENA